MAIRRVRCGSSVYVQKKSWEASTGSTVCPGSASFLLPAALRFGALVTVAEAEDAMFANCFASGREIVCRTQDQRRGKQVKKRKKRNGRRGRWCL